ncbi:hypothetical protein [Corynebacterium imitans]|uniref:hypothetical protein n=1 Tax=Corynebacterium imitans TaxID=156978 RepID=UPI0011865A98|nr:hypothetical protein [Corynebacterium imitans]
MEKLSRVTGGCIAFWASTALINVLADAPRWNIIHPLTLGVVTNAILTYSTHFADALTRTASRPLPVYVRLAAVNLALVALLFDALPNLAAATAASALLWHGASIARKLRRGLPGPFATTAYCYVAAAAFFALAVAAAVQRDIAAHSRLAVWGFAWTTIAGTVITLLPTMTRRRASPTARKRLSYALAAHCIALPAAAALLGTPLATAALLVCALAWSYALQPVLASTLFDTDLSAPALSVAAGVLWLLGAMYADAATLALGAERFPTNLLVFILAAGLAQIVAGALGHLLPVLTRRATEPDQGFFKAGVLSGGAIVALINPPIGLAILAIGLVLHARKVAFP